MRYVVMTFYDPSDGMMLFRFSAPYSTRDFASGRVSAAMRSCLAAARKHPLNQRSDGRVCRRAKCDFHIKWSGSK